jgi:TonB family protein
MKLWKFCRPSGWFLFCLVAVFATAMSVSAQDSSKKEKRIVSHDGSTVEMRTYTAIPEATEACAPAVCDWWNQIRRANADLNLGYQKKKQKSVLEARDRYFVLLYEGQQKGYRVPLKDRPPQSLVLGLPAYPYLAKKNRIKGEVVVSIEISNDGTVGDPRVTNGLGWGLDQSAIQAARQAVFLPAIKDGAFVAQQSTVKFKFTQGCAGCSGW